MRGRRLTYGGDIRTRPMKDRVREVVFNLLGPRIRGKYAIDLFAGTGAIGLEALSRGAIGAHFIEQHYPTARVIEENIRTLDVENQTKVLTADTFIWARQLDELPRSTPWAVFCSPPYDFYVERSEDMLRLIAQMAAEAPPESLLLLESDDRFDWELLDESETWSLRRFPPAVLGIRDLPPSAPELDEPSSEGTGS